MSEVPEIKSLAEQAYAQARAKIEALRDSDKTKANVFKKVDEAFAKLDKEMPIVDWSNEESWWYICFIAQGGNKDIRTALRPHLIKNPEFAGALGKILEWVIEFRETMSKVLHGEGDIAEVKAMLAPTKTAEEIPFDTGALLHISTHALAQKIDLLQKELAVKTRQNEALIDRNAALQKTVEDLLGETLRNRRDERPVSPLRREREKFDHGDETRNETREARKARFEALAETSMKWLQEISNYVDGLKESKQTSEYNLGRYQARITAVRDSLAKLYEFLDHLEDIKGTEGHDHPKGSNRDAFRGLGVHIGVLENLQPLEELIAEIERPVIGGREIKD